MYGLKLPFTLQLRHIQHENLNKFIGLGVETSCLWVVMQLGSKGTLEVCLFFLTVFHLQCRPFLKRTNFKSHGTEFIGSSNSAHNTF